MKTILLLIVLLTNALSSPKSVSIDRENFSEVLWCRITYYNPNQDKWGSRVADPKTKKAKEGVTVAAHPKFNFGTEIFIPKLKGVVGDGKFVVQDRGGAVTKKRASGGGAYVFDVYISTTRKYRNMRDNNPMYMRVYIK